MGVRVWARVLELAGLPNNKEDKFNEKEERREVLSRLLHIPYASGSEEFYLGLILYSCKAHCLAASCWFQGSAEPALPSGSTCHIGPVNIYLATH